MIKYLIGDVEVYLLHIITAVSATTKKLGFTRMDCYGEVSACMSFTEDIMTNICIDFPSFTQTSDS
jgi:hypothetical protein